MVNNCRVKVYQWGTSPNSLGDQAWYVMTETGELLAAHMSSSRSWGLRDTGPERVFIDGLPDDVEWITLDAGEYPPDETMNANQDRRKSDV